MAAEFKIQGFYFIVTDTITRDQIIRMPRQSVKHNRTASDDFYFQNNAPVVNQYGQSNLNILGAQEDFPIPTATPPIPQTIFPFSGIIDFRTGLAFASADDLDDFLCDNLGFISNGLQQVSTDATLTGDGTPSHPLSVVPTPPPTIGFYAQTVVSSTITNTTTETSIVGSGVGTLSVPANGFLVGDSFHAKIGGVISAQNGDDITINIKTGATVLATTGLISLEAVTSLGWEMEMDFTIASIGAAGDMCTNGNFAYNRNTGSLEGFVFQDVQTIDTTIINTLDITIQWNQAKTADEIYSANFVLYKVY